MEMNVTIGSGERRNGPPRSAQRTPHQANASELGVWVEKTEAMGAVKRITAEVSPDLEAAHITYPVGLTKSPALLFENITGHPGYNRCTT